MMTDFEKVLHRNSRIDRSSAMIHEFRNNRVSNLFKIQEKESLDLEDDSHNLWSHEGSDTIQ